MKISLFILLLLLITSIAWSQNKISGTITAEFDKFGGVNVALAKANITTTTNEQGQYSFENIPNGDYEIIVSYINYRTQKKKIRLTDGEILNLNFKI